uniref:Uncharacterized protein n=1 Tax=Chenopodium quinoa TaxID=63459 RepID=A0A803LFH7_CHEQI
MCGATNVPNACISCIKGDGQDAKTDVDVIQGMLGCGDDDATQLEEDVNKILDDDNTDPKTRETLQHINPWIQAIIIQGGTVQDQVAHRDFKDARSTIRDVIYANLHSCNSALSSSGISIPPPVFSGLFNVEADYKLSDQLMASVKV